MLSDSITETTMVVSTKLGKLEAVDRRLVMCQELLRFFKELEGEGVGTRSLESKARKLVEERHCKNLGGDCRPKKKVKFKNTKTDRNN